jgi:tetratricopeptide (TPR) repeat protein
MSLARRLALPGLVLVASCATHRTSDAPTAATGLIRELRRTGIDLTDIKIDSNTDLAMQSYQKFLEQTPDSGMTPEALRRLADLKVQKEYGTVEGVKRNQEEAARREAPRAPGVAFGATAGAATAAAATAARELPKPAPSAKLARGPAPKAAPLADAGKKTRKDGKDSQGKALARKSSPQEFEARATRADRINPAAKAGLAAADGSALELQGEAGDAIALYHKLLEKYPRYEQNDQVLYQLARAYDELGMTDKAMRAMGRIVREFPKSRYLDELQFRIGEYNFTRRKWSDAEEAYKSIPGMGPASPFYELALYKLGWTFYKQDLYDESLHSFTALLDHKIKSGYDFEKPKDNLEQQRVEDTYRVVSLAFSNLGGSEAVSTYFGKTGKRAYEANIYANLAEHYLEKFRYNDAAATYKAFVKREPHHKVAPHYDTRVIEIFKRGGFPKLAIDAGKEFVVNYGLKSAYWNHFDSQAFPDVVGYVKKSLKELANHYHALYQEKNFAKDKPENLRESMRWYREYLASFPTGPESAAVNLQLAELLLENGSFAEAAVEFERVAYDHATQDKAAEAGYAAVYAHRKSLGVVVANADRQKAKHETIRSSLKFAQAFPSHEKAALVMISAIDDIFALQDYTLAVQTSRKFIERFPNAEPPQRRAAWVTLAHSSFDLGQYKEAEDAYMESLPLVPASDKARANLIENLAAAIYKQGEEASKQSDYKTAALHFARVAQAAPTSTIRPIAEYDGAAALIHLKDWDGAASALTAFRANHPGHELQPEVTKKMSYVYREAGKFALAAAEYERTGSESKDVEVRSAALQLAGELYSQAKETDKALAVYRRYVADFPNPLDLMVESRFKIAGILKARGDTPAYHAELKAIARADAAGGKDRTDRTRYLAASSLLVLTEPVFEQYTRISLMAPFAKNLAKKKAALNRVKEGFEAILRYQIGETTAAASYYLAEMYNDFNRSLMESQRPSLVGAEKEQYELALEEQAFPFEEKAIDVHQKNTDLVKLGIYNPWVDKSFAKLAKLVPARYAKFEESSGYVETFNRVLAFDRLTERREPVAAAAAPSPVPAQAEPTRVPAPAEPQTTEEARK